MILLLAYIQQPQGTFIVVCDVGQGDGIYMRIQKVDIVVDAGQTGAIVSCLGKYMPLFDRTIDLVIISHPQFDHYGGFDGVLDRYQVLAAVLPPVTNQNQSYPALLQELQQKGVTTKVLYAGDSVILGKSTLSFIWPSKEYTDTHSSKLVQATTGKVLGTTTDDLNNFSSMFKFSLGEFDMLFTGDATPEILSLARNSRVLDDSIEVLKVPHHGSRNGLTADFLAEVVPQLGIISAGKKNRFGHPHKEVIDILKSRNVPYKLTAQQGDIVIEVSNVGWKVKE